MAVLTKISMGLAKLSWVSECALADEVPNVVKVHAVLAAFGEPSPVANLSASKVLCDA